MCSNRINAFSYLCIVIALLASSVPRITYSPSIPPCGEIEQKTPKPAPAPAIELGKATTKHFGQFPVVFASRRVVIVPNENNGVSYWEIEKQQEKQQQLGLSSRIACLAISQPGKALAFATHEEKSRVGLLLTGTEQTLLKLEKSNDVFACICLSPDGGKLVGSRLFDSNVCVWDTRTGKMLDATRLPVGHSPKNVVFFQDSKSVATISTREVLVWELENWNVVESFQLKSCVVINCSAYDNQRNILAAGGLGVVLWDIFSKSEVAHLRPSGQEKNDQLVESICFSRDGQTLACACEGKVITILEIITRMPILRLSSGGANVKSLCFSPDNRYLAAGTDTGVVLVWDLAAAVLGKRVSGPKTPSELHKEFDKHWFRLSEKNGQIGYQAIWSLVNLGDSALERIDASLSPPKGVAPNEIKKLIVDLDSMKFNVREKAMVALKAMGEDAKKTLRDARSKPTTPEVAGRIDLLLQGFAQLAVTPEKLQLTRAIQVVELIGSEKAKTLLHKWANLGFVSWFSQESSLALRRLNAMP